MASMSESIECTVCFQTYNLTDRLPRSLICHHTVCGQCVVKLTKNKNVKCPTCRTQSPEGQVALNYALTDVLRALCEECTGHQQQGKCGHCKKRICASCIENHGKQVYSKLCQELSRMNGLLHKAIDASKNTSVLDKEAVKLATARDRIKAEIQQRRDALDKLEKQLLAEVMKTNEDNVERQMEWEKNFDDKVGVVKDFYRRTKNKIGQKYTKDILIETITQMLEHCQSLVQELTEVQNSPPVLKEYGSFVVKTTLDQSSVGSIIIQQDKTNSKAITKHHNVPDYTTLKFKCMVGSKGSEPLQFDRPYGVTCTSDQIIISDDCNHRLKFYNNNFVLQFVVGEKGSGQGQFCNPSGLAVSQEGEVFVSDYNNDRIVVLSLQGEYLREFGSPGASVNMFNKPEGLCINDGLVYIVDQNNYRIKVVKLDGTFVQNIGSKGNNPGQFENVLIRVALMSPGDGRVLVNEFKKSQLHVYTRTGQYLGLFPPSVPTDLGAAFANDVTVDKFDNVLITYNSNELAVFDRTGDLITVIGSWGTGKGQFDTPSGVSVNTTERFVIVCETDNHRVQKFVFNNK